MSSIAALDDDARTPDAARTRLQDFVSRLLEPQTRILDVGCGRRCILDLPGHYTGLDISPEGLRLNPRLDDKIVGDIQSSRLPQRAFDLVLCFDVLEHLEQPNLAVARMLATLRPDGMLVLGFPERSSPKGLATRFTPFSFHVWVARRVFCSTTAGTPGYGPFPTYMRLSLQQIQEVAASYGWRLTYVDRYESNWNRRLRTRNAVLRAAWSITEVIYWAAIRSDPKDTDIYAVFAGPARRQRVVGLGGN